MYHYILHQQVSADTSPTNPGGIVIVQWTFKIEQSHAWDFRFCFEERSQADQWHAQLSQVIDNLRVAAGAPKTSQVGRYSYVKHPPTTFLHACRNYTLS